MAVRPHKKGAPQKRITADELEFARYIAELGYKPVEAARIVFGWACEPKSREAQKARDLARSFRVMNAIKEIEKSLSNKAKAEAAITESGKLDVDTLRKYAVKKLRDFRDSSNTNSRARLHAINALEKLSDPTTDLNLILRWVDLVWRFAKVHCPCCHESYPMWEIENEKLDQWRDAMGLYRTERPKTDLERRLVALKYADRKGEPHKSQIPLLEAPERHLVCLAPARCGKSQALAYFAFMALLIPGVEIWMLAQVYETARSEHEYLMQFLRSAFHPYDDRMVKTYEDKRTNELVIWTNWGSNLRIRSAKSKGSITGRELEVALVVEPAWVPDDVFEELRARMVSRLGRIMAFGTPKGYGGFIGRMIRVTGRDPETGKMIRRTPEERLIENGSPWETSMYIGHMKPEDNPVYPLAEKEAARQELTDEEYASEFLGEMVMAEGAKFPNVAEHHLKSISGQFYQEAVYVLSLDQGPSNFAACLTGYDKSVIISCYEFFDGSSDTMKKNLKKLMREVPKHLGRLGAQPQSWVLTITDRAPLLDGIFLELEEEGTPWPTPITTVPRNVVKFNQNWRRDTTEFVNNMAARSKLLFDLQYCVRLHTQVREVMNIPLPDKNLQHEGSKGWKVNDSWYGDHLLDAWLFGMCAIHLGMVAEVKNADAPKMEPWQEARAAQDYLRAKDERQELQGYPVDYSVRDDELFRQHFGRNPPSAFDIPRWGHYPEES